MNEPIPSTQVPHESLGYQPVSGWAVAGFVVGALFALLVTVSAIAGLLQGSPVFFPVWIMSIAIVGVVLSWIGIRHVQNSEGTRAGAKLARIGIWLSLVSGLCYSSYYFFTRLAQEGQANAFLMEMSEDGGFFPRLKEGATKPAQINAAFLLTLPANNRHGRPEDEYDLRLRYDRPTKDGPGLWSSFADGIYTRVLFKHLAADAEITPLAVTEWKYDARSYKVGRIYRVKTKELTTDFLMTVQSTEAESTGGARKWFVNLNESGILHQTKQFTDVGKGVQIVRMRAYEKLDLWIKSLERGQPFAFKDVDETVWDRLHVTEKEGGPKRSAVREAVTSALSGSEKNRLFNAKINARPEDIGKWEQLADGKVRIYLPIHFALAIAGDGGRLTSTEVDAHIGVETKQAIDLPRFDPLSPPPDWDIVRIVITNAGPTPEAKGPGGL